MSTFKIIPFIVRWSKRINRSNSIVVFNSWKLFLKFKITVISNFVNVSSQLLTGYCMEKSDNDQYQLFYLN